MIVSQMLWIGLCFYTLEVERAHVHIPFCVLARICQLLEECIGSRQFLAISPLTTDADTAHCDLYQWTKLHKQGQTVSGSVPWVLPALVKVLAMMTG